MAGLYIRTGAELSSLKLSWKRIIVCVRKEKGVPPKLGKERRKEIPHETNDDQEFATGL
jgi:hypothetical protein